MRFSTVKDSRFKKQDFHSLFIKSLIIIIVYQNNFNTNILHKFLPQNNLCEFTTRENKF